jgi:adenosylcobinamide-GDP ribazoletransferase
MPVRDELPAAVRSLTGRGAPASTSRAILVGALAFYPVIGLALGAFAAGVAAVLAPLVPSAAGPAGVLVLVVLTAGRGPQAFASAASALLHPGPPAVALARLRDVPAPAAVVVALAATAMRAAAAAVLPAPARTTGLLLAPMLGAWAIVVQCYGGAPVHARGAAAGVVGRARFREFGWASVVALGVTLAAGEPIGLVLVLAASLVTIGLRVWAHRRIGGLTGKLLAATRECVETAVLVTLALLVGAPG